MGLSALANEHSLISWKAALFLALALKLQYVFQNISDPWNPKKQLNVFMKIFHTSLSRFGQLWNQYEIHGVDKIRDHPVGGSLLVGYHSRPTVDLMYLFATLKPKIIVSHLFFRVPFFNPILDQMGVIPSKAIGQRSPEESFIEAITTPGRPTVLLPGGIYDAMKPYDQKHTVNWKNPPGFARVMCDHKDLLKQKGGVQVIPFYTRNCELAFSHVKVLHDFFGSTGMMMYRSFNKGNLILLPFLLTCFLCAFGFLFLPNRVKLDTYLGEALTLQDHETAEEFGKRVATSVQDLINKVRKMDEKNGKVKINRVTAETLSEQVNVFILGSYALVQNVLFVLVILCLIWTTFLPVLVFTIVKTILKVVSKQPKELAASRRDSSESNKNTNKKVD